MSNFKDNSVFDKSIIISNKEGNTQTTNGAAGQLRFNQTTLKYEGYHSYPNSDAGADIFGNNWRSLTQDVASESKLGIIRVGTNLNMNQTTGILSSVATGVSRIFQLVITVSPIVGAADYQTINEAISHAIGTPEGNYIDGILTSNIGGTNTKSAPSATYPFVIQLSPGQYSEPLNRIILPDYVTLRGEDNYNSVITQNIGSNLLLNQTDENNIALINVGQNCELKNLVINLADTNSSNTSGAIYSFNKSNVVIDNCIISINYITRTNTIWSTFSYNIF